MSSIKENPVKKITRIEIRYDGKSKSITLDHTNASDLAERIRGTFKKIVKPINIDLPVTDSPLRHVKKCAIQIYEATTRSMVTKDNFNSFTCYGITSDEAMDAIQKIISESDQ